MSFVASTLVKSYFTATRYGKIHQKFVRRKMRSSFEIIDFFIFEPNFFRNMRIFKKKLAMKIGKSIFQNLMSSAPLRLYRGYVTNNTSNERKETYEEGK